MKRVLGFTLAVAVLTLLGLSGITFHNRTTAFAQQGKGTPPIEAGGGAPEIIKHRGNPDDADSDTGFATVGGTGSLSPISYHGGKLIATPTVYLIFYGNWNRGNGTDTPAGQQIVTDFAQSISGSNYFFINTSYSAGGQTITGNVVYGGATNVGYTYGTRLRDASIQSIVNDAIAGGRFPYDQYGVYFVLTSSDVAENSGFCTQYCGWHTAGTPSVGHVRYSFVGNAARCLSSCAAQSIGPNGNAGVDGMISVIAHELEEATTDPDPRSGWADASGAENADKCAWTFGSKQYKTANGASANVHLGARDFLIQRNLRATDNKCYIDGRNLIQ
jgi:hypothetical protein